ncbi:FMN reductase (NADPH) 2 (plasmid) [Rhizobium phaseoli]|uniref:FMN reductase n=1 Tax=Rhizobium phaseoli TaxID=396 RepID=UPI0007EA94AD|nr:FMN reductase [Rhizobium phaseoli]ANL67885.1 FMN reductase (NADPH) 2 [Rhizobium phaseoli]ANL80699.1 FMN reductase (NADPH) 2 [Rhizobium phaseoli]
MNILALSGNVKRPSRTASLVNVIADRLQQRIDGHLRPIELVDAAPVLFRALRADQLDTEGKAIVAAVERADIIIVGSPVYRASYSGALKHLFDLVDYRALSGKRVVLAATGGTPLHGLMLEHQLRPLFGFFNAITVPTGVYALEADFTDHQLTNPAVLERVDRAVEEIAAISPLADAGVTAAGKRSELAA